MSAITLLGSARRACTGPTRRETLKVGALSLLGGLFNTPSLLALGNVRQGVSAPGPGQERRAAVSARRTADAGHVRPQARGAGRRRRRIQAHRHQCLGRRDLRAAAADGPLDAQVGDRPQRVSQRRLPQEPADVHRLRRQPARRGVSRQRSAQHGLGVRLSRARSAKGVADVCLSSLPARLGRDSQEGRTARRLSGPPLRSVFAPSARPIVDNPPDDIWKPQVVRGEPQADRHRAARRDHARSAQRPPPAGRAVRRRVPRARRPSATWAIFRASSGWPSRCSRRPKSARRSI